MNKATSEKKEATKLNWFVDVSLTTSSTLIFKNSAGAMKEIKVSDFISFVEASKQSLVLQ